MKIRSFVKVLLVWFAIIAVQPTGYRTVDLFFAILSFAFLIAAEAIGNEKH